VGRFLTRARYYKLNDCVTQNPAPKIQHLQKPLSFTPMIAEERLIMFRNRLLKVFRHTGKQAKKLSVTCYRLYDHDLPEFPFCIEFYENNIYVAEYKRRHGMTESEHEDWIAKSIEVIMEVLGVPKEAIFLKLRQRKAGRLGQYQKLDEQQHEFLVEENGLKFYVNLSDYLDTGLFLDHRPTRQLVRDMSNGKKVLNLFAYTGSFSVYAAAGGASEVVTVDLSKTYLDWAQKNMQANGFTELLKYKFVHADVKQFLPSLHPDYYDVIILDPPTFSNSSRMKDFLDIQRDHVEMINQCITSLVPGGALFFSTNSTHFVLDKEKIMASAIKDITKATTAFDFEGKLSRYCFRISK
jgi:23S rRNA (cytosine1962-C5)-methyltransferase